MAKPPIGDVSLTTFTGNLAEDPDLSYNKAGRPWAKLRVMTNRRQAKRVEGSDDVEWSDAPATARTVTVDGPLAINVDQSLRRGDPVIVIGYEITESYEVRNEAGEVSRRYATKVRAEVIGPSLKNRVATLRRADPPKAVSEDNPEPAEAEQVSDGADADNAETGSDAAE